MTTGVGPIYSTITYVGFDETTRQLQIPFSLEEVELLEEVLKAQLELRVATYNPNLKIVVECTIVPWGEALLRRRRSLGDIRMGRIMVLTVQEKLQTEEWKTVRAKHRENVKAIISKMVECLNQLC